MAQALSFSVFSKAFCAVKLCQGNADGRGRYESGFILFLLSSVLPLPFFSDSTLFVPKARALCL